MFVEIPLLVGNDSSKPEVSLDFLSSNIFRRIRTFKYVPKENYYLKEAEEA